MAEAIYLQLKTPNSLEASSSVASFNEKFPYLFSNSAETDVTLALAARHDLGPDVVEVSCAFTHQTVARQCFLRDRHVVAEGVCRHWRLRDAVLQPRQLLAEPLVQVAEQRTVKRVANSGPALVDKLLRGSSQTKQPGVERTQATNKGQET